MITLSIDATKVDKARLKPGQKGQKYLDLVLWENKDGPDRYGNDGFVTQGQSKEERAANAQRMPIIGNWRSWQKPQQSKPAPAAPTQPTTANPEPSPIEDEDVPF